MAWGSLTKFAQTLKKGEHASVSGELRDREYDKEVGKSKDTVRIPVAEIHTAETRPFDLKAAPNGETLPE